METAKESDLLRSQLVRHPWTGELFMIDRDAAGGVLAFVGPLAPGLADTSGMPRALVGLPAALDWYVRSDAAEGPAAEDADAAEAPDDEAGPGEDADGDENGSVVAATVLAWAAGVAWQPVATYRRIDQFGAPAGPDGEPRFERTVYMLESSAGEGAAPAPSAAGAPPPLWSGPGPVPLG